MSIFAFDCRKAVYTALLGLVGGRIYADPPQSVVFPWIEIGDRQIIPDDTSSWSVLGGSDAGVSDFFDLHVWGRNGRKEVEDLFGEMHSRLHGVALAVTGRVSALSWVRNIRDLRDPDGITIHGVVTVEIIHRS